MDIFWKGIAAVLIAVILGLHIGKQEKELHLLLVMAVCCLGAGAVLTFLEPVLELLRELETIAGTENGILSVLLKCTGLALVTELAGLICQDSGSSSLGKMVQLLGSAAILYLSIPMITAMVTLIREILGDL